MMFWPDSLARSLRMMSRYQRYQWLIRRRAVQAVRIHLCPSVSCRLIVAQIIGGITGIKTVQQFQILDLLPLFCDTAA